MKQLLFLLLTITLFTACNNNKNPLGGGGGLGGKPTKSNWSTAERTKALNDCIVEGGNNDLSKQLCSCVMDKLEKKYPDAEDARNASKTEIEKMTRDCMAGGNGEEGGDELNGNKNNRKKIGGEGEENENEDNNGGNTGGGSWTSQQFKQYVQECATAVQQNFGYTSEQANSYCDCLTKKVVKQYTYQQVVRLTAQDFATQEWEDARAECQPRY